MNNVEKIKISYFDFNITCLTICTTVACWTSTSITSSNSNTRTTVSAWIVTARIYYKLIHYEIYYFIFQQEYYSNMFDRKFLNNREDIGMYMLNQLLLLDKLLHLHIGYYSMDSLNI